MDILFYDLYRSMIDEILDIFHEKDADKAFQRAQSIDSLREILERDPTFLIRSHGKPPASFLKLVETVKRCKPYVLTQGVAKLGIDMVHTSGKKAILPSPMLTIPLWIELDHAAIGHEEEKFVALFLHEPDWWEENNGLLALDFLSPNMQRAKTLYLRRDGYWEFEQIGVCPSTACTLAKNTIEGEPFRLRETDASYCQECVCYEAGNTFSQIYRAFNHLLLYRKRPLTLERIDRASPLPHATDKPLTRKQKEENSRAAALNRPFYTRLSLSQPVKLFRSPKRDAKVQIEEEEGQEKINVSAHLRWLIPGEGLPWKDLQILIIENYDRSGRPSDRQRRTIVEE